MTSRNRRSACRTGAPFFIPLIAAIALVLQLLPTLAAGAAYEVIDLSVGTSALGGAAWGIDAGQPVGVRIFSSNSHAAFWPDPAAPPVDLNPAGFLDSVALAHSAGRQVGWASSNGTLETTHAMLWSGTAGSVVDLNPPGFLITIANGISGNQQVGLGFRPDSGWSEALLWNGTAASAVSLHPAGTLSSEARGAWGGRQVGSVILTENDRPHAFLWSGNAASAIDLHPAGFTWSEANGIAAGQQVGGAIVAGEQPVSHAIIWFGSAEGFVDLHPANAVSSGAAATNGRIQVGSVSMASTGPTRAALWEGSADTAFDLDALLPAGQFNGSQAAAIDADGNIVGVAYPADMSRAHAILWRVVPEPSGLAATAACAVVALLRRRRMA